MGTEHWMQGAVHPERRGVFTTKAESHKMTPLEYAKQVLAGHIKASAVTKKQANFAKVAHGIMMKRKA